MARPGSMSHRIGKRVGLGNGSRSDHVFSPFFKCSQRSKLISLYSESVMVAKIRVAIRNVLLKAIKGSFFVM